MTYRLDEATNLLAATPPLLDAWLRPLDDAWLTATEGPDTWNALDVVGHLVHGEETDWIPRARHLLDRFREARAESLATLASWGVVESDLARTTLHPEFGRVTLGQHLATWVAHDLDHVAQIARVMARRYAEDLGPWGQYQPIVRRRSD